MAISTSSLIYGDKKLSLVMEAACIVVAGVSEWILARAAPTNPPTCSYKSGLTLAVLPPLSRCGVNSQLEEVKFERWRKCGARTRTLYSKYLPFVKASPSPFSITKLKD